MPSITSIHEDQALARTEILINLTFIKHNRATFNTEALVEAYDQVTAAMQEYLEAEEKFERETANGRPSEHVMVCAEAAEGSER